jgi:aryl-alcohol dehydrogenase-like predicted oxidoreductase
MEYTYLGRTGLQVSRLCLGTMNFGPHTSETDSFQIMDHALEMGINFFDTADVYGWKLGEGVTEQIIGHWLAQGGRREQIVLATKVYGEMGKGINDQHLSAYHIRKSCDDSLRRLQTDHIDLYQMHHVDRNTPWEEIWQALEQLIQAGKILYVGSSNFAGWDIVHANCIAEKRNLFGIVSEQSKYNLLTRHIERELIPVCKEFGVGIICWSPLDSGTLSGVLKTGKIGIRRSEDYVWDKVKQSRQLLQAWEQLCEDLGESPANIALAWLLQQPAVTGPVIGPRTLEQLQEVIRAVDIKLSNEALARIDEIFPPTGEAPQYYAW